MECRGGGQIDTRALAGGGYQFDIRAEVSWWRVKDESVMKDHNCKIGRGVIYLCVYMATTAFLKKPFTYIFFIGLVNSVLCIFSFELHRRNSQLPSPAMIQGCFV